MTTANLTSDKVTSPDGLGTKQLAAESAFLDLQAAVGISKHIGGFPATDEILKLCHIEEARAVLYVGCGIGVGPVYIARRYGCRVVGVDLSQQMMTWAQKRVGGERMGGLVDLGAADVLQLPFAARSFDVVICESVLIFVVDKAQAIEECVRVTRTGGYTGINESFWFVRPEPAVEARVKTAIGPAVPTGDEWEALWGVSGLGDRCVRKYRVDPREEVKSRVAWIGWRWLLPAWGRAARLYLTNPAQREAIKNMTEIPPEVYGNLGYAVLVGQKQPHS